MQDDKRLIEDYLPINSISINASREKKHPRHYVAMMHYWPARRPITASRAAVYGTLVPAPRNDGERIASKAFLERLCRWEVDRNTLKEAKQKIFDTYNNFKPKVLDFFAGGGAIPLEAVRLGCETYALELNPVAYLIDLCTLVFPQKYGKANRNAKGSASDTTWAGLAKEVSFWGNWVLKKTQEELKDLYPPIKDPDYEATKEADQSKFFGGNSNFGYLTPVAYIWTRTVTCRNPHCGGTVPLMRQSWLCRKKGRYIAAKPNPIKSSKKIQFEISEAPSTEQLNFNPKAFAIGGNAVCLFCGSTIDTDFTKAEAQAGRMGMELVSIVCEAKDKRNKVYLSPLDVTCCLPSKTIHERIDQIVNEIKINPPLEQIPKENSAMATVKTYGFLKWADLFAPRQLYALMAFLKNIRIAKEKIKKCVQGEDELNAIMTYLAMFFDRIALSLNSFSRWESTDQITKGIYSQQVLSMVGDFSEINPFANTAGSATMALKAIVESIDKLSFNQNPARVTRGSADTLPFEDRFLDAIITDPPYYDNIFYADLSDYFYPWLKRLIGDLYPDHFAGVATPKKKEAVVQQSKHDGDSAKAKNHYEKLILGAFHEAHRVLKNNGYLICVYAHKTTAGWASLVDALRSSGFVITEAWPIDTESSVRFTAREASALASSIFLVARKRDDFEIGFYEENVRNDLENTVRERVETLWEMGISGADLVIAAVGAGLSAFTRFYKVEYANGEEVPAERFLAEVETVVLETILERLSKEVDTNEKEFSLAGVDPTTRFYILWRYTYKYSVLDGGEAIVFANGTHVELDGPNGLSTGARALLEKKKGKYTLNDYTDRGSDEKLGQMMEDGQAAPMVDALHRTLWLMENRPGELPTFLQEAQPNREEMRLVAQALAGPALKGGELGDISPHAELSALAKLTANWKSVIEGAALTPLEKKERETGQRSLFK